MDTTIELADGTKFPGTVGRARADLMLVVKRSVAQQHLLDFGDKEKMKKIVFHINERASTEFEGFDTFRFLEFVPNTDDVRVWMWNTGV